MVLLGLPCQPAFNPAAVEALLRYFIAAPAVPLSEKIVRYMPTDTRSVLKIVRTAAGEAEARLLQPALLGAPRVLGLLQVAGQLDSTCK